MLTIHVFADVARPKIFLLLPPLSLNDVSTEERDIEVKQADLKKHLTLMDLEGKPM